MSNGAKLQAEMYDLALDLGLFPIRFNSGKLVGSGYSYAYSWGPQKDHDGLTDLAIVLPNGRVAWIEVKGEGDKIRDSQLRFKEEIENNGGLWYLVESIDQFRYLALLLREGSLDG